MIYKYSCAISKKLYSHAGYPLDDYLSNFGPEPYSVMSILIFFPVLTIKYSVFDTIQYLFVCLNQFEFIYNNILTLTSDLII